MAAQGRCLTTTHLDCTIHDEIIPSEPAQVAGFAFLESRMRRTWIALAALLVVFACALFLGSTADLRL
jgi:hypothetical protein